MPLTSTIRAATLHLFFMFPFVFCLDLDDTIIEAIGVILNSHQSVCYLHARFFQTSASPHQDDRSTY